MRTPRLMRFTWLSQFVVVPALAFGCASGVTTQRYVDSPIGKSHEYGTPQNTSYSAEVETEKDVLRVLIFEQSECEKIRVRIVQRTEETVRGGEVIARDPMGPIQVADGTDGVVPCRQRFARDVRVTLKVGSATHLLGQTNPRGELAINLSAELEQSLYGEAAPEPATLVVEGQDVQTVPFDQLKQHETRLTALVAEFEALLNRPQTELSEAELAHSYVLFNQLGQLDRRDARVSALRFRFLEMAYGRKKVEATEDLKRNLDALKSAKELLTNTKGTPMFMQVGIQSGATSVTMINWAQGQLLMGLRQNPSFCQSQVSWTRLVAHSWAGPTQVAVQYLRYAHGDPFISRIQRSCTTVIH